MLNREKKTRENCVFVRDLATKGLTPKAYNQNARKTAKLFFAHSDSCNDLYGLKCSWKSLL